MAACCWLQAHRGQRPTHCWPCGPARYNSGFESMPHAYRGQVGNSPSHSSLQSILKVSRKRDAPIIIAPKYDAAGGGDVTVESAESTRTAWSYQVRV